MSDERLRELERRWRESGTAEGEAAYLRERVRVGDLSQERLELAAHCGHPASVLATRRSASEPDARAEVETWLQGLTIWGREPLELAAVLVARIVLRQAQGGVSPKDEGAFERVPTAVEQWIACPCQAHLDRALHAGSDAVRGTRLEDAGWCAAAAASVDTASTLLARVIQRAEQTAPIVAEVCGGLIEWALVRDPPGDPSAESRAQQREGLGRWTRGRCRMSDDKLRELERWFKETGSVEDEAAWLMERVRIGELTQKRLELAAYCGHEGARAVSQPVRHAGEEFFVGLLRNWGRGAVVWAASLAARSCLPVWESALAGDSRPRLAVEFATQWALSAEASEFAATKAEEALMLADDAADDARDSRQPDTVVAAAFAAMGSARAAYWGAMGSSWDAKILEDTRWVSQRVSQAREQTVSSTLTEVRRLLAQEAVSHTAT